MAETDGCFICTKHAQGDAAPGGVIYDDGVAYAGHAHPLQGSDVYLGFLAVEPKRHAARLGDLNDEESQRIGWLTNRLARALREVAGAEHVYSFVFGDGPAGSHLHVMLMPRYAGTPREYWGLGAVRLREWRDGPRGGVDEMRELCARLAAAVKVQDSAESDPCGEL